jgi:hypothetical protein
LAPPVAHLLRAESWTVGTASAASARSLVRQAPAVDEQRASGDEERAIARLQAICRNA